MRILIVHSIYRTGPASGENQVVKDEARLLSEGGHDVRLFTPAPSSDGAIRTVKSGLDAVWSISSTREVVRLIDTFHPDTVHCHNVVTGVSPAVLRVAAQRDVPVVMTLHNYRLMCLPGTFLKDGRICEACLGKVPWRGIKWRCYKGSTAASSLLSGSLMLHRMLGSFDGISLFCAVSQFLRDKHIEGGMDPHRIVVKPNFSWPTDQANTQDYFLYMGRLAPEKGVATLMAAWPGIDARLLVAGDGPEGRRLAADAPPRVEFLGTVDHQRALDLLRGARALLVPSLWYEGAPRTILEAYAAGVPVLASRLGALQEIVEDSASGLLLPPSHPAAWREAVRKMLLDASLSSRLAKGAREQWRQVYAPDRALQNLEAVYHRAMKSVRRETHDE
jgi:glycosyltransferase involved in cell wall biosynthesis